jgi:hypothetical protein
MSLAARGSGRSARGRSRVSGVFPLLQPVCRRLAGLVGLVHYGRLGVPAPGEDTNGQPAGYCRLPSHLLFSGWAPLSGQVATGAKSWA